MHRPKQSQNTIEYTSVRKVLTRGQLCMLAMLPTPMMRSWAACTQPALFGRARTRLLGVRDVHETTSVVCLMRSQL